MIKTVRKFRVGEVKEDYFWALSLSDQQRIDLATSLTSDLWRAATATAFPRINRQVEKLVVQTS